MLKHVVAALALLAMAGTAQAETIKVGATSGPHAEVLEAARAVAAKNGLDIKIIEFSDYIQPNVALAAGDLDANSFQHLPFLQAQIEVRKLNLIPVGKTVLFPIAVYSKKYKRIEDLPDGAEITIPVDPANSARSLILFETAGLIRLREGVGIKATVFDIVDNPHRFKFREIESAQLVHSLEDVAASAVNTNYAIEAHLNPERDSLLLESPQSQYTCEIVIRPEDKDKPWVKKFVAAYQSPEVKRFIETRFPGAGFAGW